MPDLNTTIRQIVENCVQNLTDAIQAHALLAFSGSSSAKRAPGRPKSVTKTAAPKARAKGGRRSPAQIKKTLSDVLAFIKGHEGTRAEDVRKALKITPTQNGDALGRLLEAKKIKSRGERRATKYFKL